jgi:peptidoglycan hydrolase CwlO-like protein
MTSLSELLISESESDSDETRSMFSDSDSGSDDTIDSTVKLLLSYDTNVQSMKKEIKGLKQQIADLKNLIKSGLPDAFSNIVDYM